MTPYRESGRAVEARWAAVKLVTQSNGSRKAGWALLWFCVMLVWRYMTTPQGQWVSLYHRVGDLPVQSGPLDGLAASQYNFTPSERPVQLFDFIDLQRQMTMAEQFMLDYQLRHIEAGIERDAARQFELLSRYGSTLLIARYTNPQVNMVLNDA